MQEWIELIRATIRPFIIIWGFIVYGVCVMAEVEIPLLLAGMVATVILEYFGERAMLRLNRNNGTGVGKGEA